jgi:hypothetical protein
LNHRIQRFGRSAAGLEGRAQIDDQRAQRSFVVQHLERELAHKRLAFRRDLRRQRGRQPNKLRAERVGDIISQSFYYNGRLLTLSNPNEGYYATVPAPASIDTMLDFARDSLDVIAPGGDLISENAYERLMDDTTAGFVVGKSAIGGVRCDHIAFRGRDLDWQVWIEDGDKPFPRKYVITTLDVAGSPQYEVVMNNWTTTPDVSAKQFEFTPPAGATKIEFLPVGTAGAPQ